MIVDSAELLYSAGFLHPIIHLGFGVEFQQPAIIAEALAQACVHDNRLAPLFFESEKEAMRKLQQGHTSKTLLQLLEEIRADTKLSSAAHLDDNNKIYDGVMARAPQEMLQYATQFLVRPDELEEKTAEMINAAGKMLLPDSRIELMWPVYFTGAAQHPPNQIKFDFYYIHSVNSSIFFSSFMKQDWLSKANKVRLLEWKARCDLAMYASRASPPLLLDEITNYESKQDSSWDEIFRRVVVCKDDSHAAKLVRALKNGEQICSKYQGKAGFVIEGDMWRKLGNMAIDSVDAVEAGQPDWVRNAGFEAAWEKVPLRKDSARL